MLNEMGPAQAKLARVIVELGGSATFDRVLERMFRDKNVGRTKTAILNIARRANRLHGVQFRWNATHIKFVGVESC